MDEEVIPILRVADVAAAVAGFRGFQYVLGEQGRVIEILYRDESADLDAITELVGSWFQDHISPRLAAPETAMRGRVVVDTRTSLTSRVNST